MLLRELFVQRAHPQVGQTNAWPRAPRRTQHTVPLLLPVEATASI
jgi:hypothetical protein